MNTALDDVVKGIQKYLLKEFEDENPVDVAKPIPLMFTTWDYKECEDTELQMYIDLANMQYIYEISYPFGTETFKEDVDIITLYVDWVQYGMDFQALYEATLDYVNYESEVC